MRFICLVRDRITLFPKLSFILFCNRTYVACILFTSKIEAKSWTFQSLISFSGRMLKNVKLSSSRRFDLLLKMFLNSSSHFLLSSPKCFCTPPQNVLLFSWMFLHYSSSERGGWDTIGGWRYPTPLLSSGLIPLQRATTYLMLVHFIHFIHFHPYLSISSNFIQFADIRSHFYPLHSSHSKDQPPIWCSSIPFTFMLPCWINSSQ